MAKKEKLKIQSKQHLLSLEREVLGFNLTSIMGDNKLKIDTSGFNHLAYVNDLILDGKNINNCITACIIEKIEHKTSARGNHFCWIYLIDDYSSLKIYCSEKTLREYTSELIIANCCLFNINIKNDFVTFDKCKRLDLIPFKKDYIFVIHLDFDKWTDDIINYIEDNIGVAIQKGTVQVFQRSFAQQLFIAPTYELIDYISAVYGVKCSLEKYEDYIWGESNKLIKELEEYENNRQANIDSNIRMGHG